jgi:phenylacetate-CoA ligase
MLEAARPDRLAALRRLEESQWMPLETLREIQREKLLKLLRHAGRHVPYYRDEFERLGINPEDLKGLKDLQHLPLLNKSQVREHSARLIADNVARRDCLPNTTSGSTGHILKFYNDRRTSDFVNAVGLRASRWTGWTLGDRQAMLWGRTADDRTSGLYGRIKNLVIHKKMFLSTFDMSQTQMIEYRDRINRFKPKLIHAYASALYLFCRYLKDCRLDIYRPLGAVTTAETLYPLQREMIASTLDCPVFSRYGSREVSWVAQDCKEGRGLHIFAEHVVVEILNERQEPCQPGEIGRLVVTDLDNYAFPFIRYDLGDLGIVNDSACPCGRGLPLLDRIEGRVWDVITGTNGNHMVGPGWLFRGINGIRQFQVVQDRVEELRLYVVGEADFGETERQMLVQRILSHCGKDMKIDLRLVDCIPPASSGKHRYILSKVSPYL